MKQYFTKTGIELRLIQGGSQGDGIPRANLRLVEQGDQASQFEKDLMSQDELDQWLVWINETFGDEAI